ncbi:MAG TPA: hypothetical protein VHE34_05420 [Puia sp.]|uniref:hypothetical protein n=1 Tax=Puia sp. TaxID=2045100 RepID=UPI002C4BF16A|nr:hypothetical protein [Puia sp.]HVU94640.1 hypothetical protein [Puia sp.]
MKYVIALILLIAVVLNGLTSYHLFENSVYGLSNLMIISSYLSIVFSIFLLTMSKRKSAMELE